MTPTLGARTVVLRSYGRRFVRCPSHTLASGASAPEARRLSIRRASIAGLPLRTHDAPVVAPTMAELHQEPDGHGAREFLDLATLMERLRQELPISPSVGDPVDKAVKARVTGMLKRTRLNPREWEQHAIYRKGRYTRNIVGFAPGQFVALLLCWARGQQSPIHAHAGAHCFVKLLSGKLTEELYDAGEAGVNPVPIRVATMDASDDENSVSFMHDSLGVHRILNPAADEDAVSLHIYSPPFSQCLVYPPTGAPPITAPMVSIVAPEGLSEQQASGRFTLDGLCQALPQAVRDDAGRPSAMGVLDILAQVQLSKQDWAAYASSALFSEFRCVRHLVYCDDTYSVVISCWSPGQGVPRHTVGRGRQVWLKVLRGNLLFQEFSPGLFPYESDVEQETQLVQGSTSVLKQCAVKMHRFVNPSEEEAAVSIHVFSPPLTQFTYQTSDGIERRDVPALVGRRSSEAAAADAAAIGVAELERATPGRSLDVPKLHGLTHSTGRHYLSLLGLAKLLDNEFASSAPSEQAVLALLKKAVFDREEWRSCLARAFIGHRRFEQDQSVGAGSAGDMAFPPRRALLAHRPGYSLSLAFWSHGRGNVAGEALREPAGIKSWTLILEGELEELGLDMPEGCSPPRVVRTTTLQENSLTFLGGSYFVERRCDTDVPCVSLHIHSPPLPYDGSSV